MTRSPVIRRARAEDAATIAALAGELLDEIMAATGTQAFSFDLDAITRQLQITLADETYFVFTAHLDDGQAIGFIALCECRALYAGGTFGTIPELFVRPQYRSGALGQQLVAAARTLGAARGWTRLEVTTPPLPQFDRTLAFYEREGFSITGGRKLKAPL